VSALHSFTGGGGGILNGMVRCRKAFLVLELLWGTRLALPLQKVEKKRTSDSENLIACEVAETAPPKNFYTDHLTMMVAKIVT
jgi:hypothetical protein